MKAGRGVSNAVMIFWSILTVVMFVSAGFFFWFHSSGDLIARIFSSGVKTILVLSIMVIIEQTFINPNVVG